MILPYDNKTPRIASSVFIARGVVISGDVEIGEETSIWYNTVLRGDVAPTIIGRRVNIQDNCTLHQSPGKPLIIEDEVSVGHNAVLHSCHVKKGALIGMGAIVLDGAVIGEGAMVAAGALVPPGQEVPPGTVVMGSPARVVRKVTSAEEANLERIRKTYVEKGQYYKQLEKEYKW
jgi:carbonic anhydrase/acetyltransferase-like protein (isoleucine patch superfamily)